jgi:hypothetical protein
MKTMKKKNFDNLVKNGISDQHYTQMMLYMMMTRLQQALYLVVCKDDDQLYTEVVGYDASYADAAMRKAQRIIDNASVPVAISTRPDWHVCKFCDHHAICFESQPMMRSCRTCQHSSPADDGCWLCYRFECDVTVQEQAQAGQLCAAYEAIALDRSACSTSVLKQSP